MSGASPARLAALAVLSEVRRRDARVRDVMRSSTHMAGLSDADRALATRLAAGTTSARAVLDGLLDERLRRPSSVEPRVRDALRLAAFDLCYLGTPSAVAVSQGVELARVASPRAAGLANAVLRRMAAEVFPQVAGARERCEWDQSPSLSDLVLAGGIPSWLVERVARDRGQDLARRMCLGQLDGAPTCVAANGLRHSAASLEELLVAGGMNPVPIEHLPGSFVLGNASSLAGSGLVDNVDLVVCDQSAQLVCRLVAPSAPCEALEVGQGRGTKSVLLATGVGAVRPAHVTGIDSVGYKVGVSRRRMERAGAAGVVSCLPLDARLLAGDDLPQEVAGHFGLVLVDAPCSGTGTMRRHPETPSRLSGDDVRSLASLQEQVLSAAAARVAPGGALAYSTCSVLREEDEDVVEGFLAGPAGAGFRSVDVLDAPACGASPTLRGVVASSRTPGGHLLTTPERGAGDGHFLALMQRVG